MATLEAVRQADSRAQLVQRAGANLSLAASDSAAEVGGTSLVEEFPPIFRFAASLISEARLPAAEFERQLAISRNRSEGSNQIPATDLLAQGVFAGWAAEGGGSSPASAYGVALGFHRQHFAPAETFVGVIGDMLPADLLRIVATSLEPWQPNGVQEAVAPAPVASPRAQGLLVPQPASTLSRFTIGAEVCGRLDADSAAVEVLNAVIGRSDPAGCLPPPRRKGVRIQPAQHGFDGS